MNKTRVSLIFLAATCCSFGRANADAMELFGPFLGDAAPKIAEVTEKKTEGAIEITRLRFVSRTTPEGEDVLIYGVLARPSGPGPFPGILVCHGGGGNADAVAPAVKNWAKRGYIAFCQDEPGIGDAKNSSGPWGKWDSWRCEPDPTRNSLYDGVVAALGGFNLLRAQAGVDPNRIGVTGGSWGGYLTLLISGLKSDRVKTAFGVYGAGFYDKGTVFQGSMAKRLNAEEQEVWLENFDPARIAGRVTASYFLAAAACDWFFWPSSVQASFDAIQSPKNIVYSPNTSHALSFPGGNTGATPVDASVNRAKQEIDWMNFHLKGEGKPFPVCTQKKPPARAPGGMLVSFRVDAETPIVDAAVWYAYGETPWRTRYWKKVNCRQPEPGVYEATIPVEEPGYPLDWFGLVTDDRPVSTSTVMCRVLPSDIGFGQADRNVSPWEAAIGDPDQWRKTYDPPKLSPGGRYSILQDAFNGKPAVEIRGNYALECAGIRGVSLAGDHAEGIALWVRSLAGTGFSLQIFSEGANASYSSWEATVADPGQDWKRTEIPWGDFKPIFGAKGPILGEATAKLRIITPPDARILIGGVSGY